MDVSQLSCLAIEKTARCMSPFKSETNSYKVGTVLYVDQLITTAERKLVRKTHLPGGYLKKESSWSERTLEKTSAIGESGWGNSSLKCFSLSSVLCYSPTLSSLLYGRHTHTYPSLSSPGVKQTHAL